MDTIKVVCGIICKGDKIFICRRKPEKSMGGYWEFPGGKIEAGESFEESLIRELDEELGMKVVPLNHFTTVIHTYDTFIIELIALKCRLVEKPTKLTDHDAADWVSAKDLKNIQFAPADILIIQELLSQETK